MAKEVSKKKEKKKKGRKTEEGSDEDDSNLSDEEVCMFLYPKQRQLLVIRLEPSGIPLSAHG